MTGVCTNCGHADCGGCISREQREHYLLLSTLKVLKDIEWDGNVEGSYDYQNRTVSCPSCGVEVDALTGAPASEEDEDEEEDEDDVDLVKVLTARLRRVAMTINSFAYHEGWAIFNIDDDPTIQRDDDKNLFPDDDAAVAYVQRMADAGSKLHQRALEVVKKQTAKLEEKWKHDGSCKLNAILQKAVELGIKIA